MIGEALLVIGALLTGPLDWACVEIPDEPDAQEAVSEGPKGFSGLYEHDYDLGGGRRLLTERRIVDMTTDAGFEALYTVQAHPLLYIVVVPGRADREYVDRGHGLQGIPQGLCAEIVRYQ